MFAEDEIKILRNLVESDIIRLEDQMEKVDDYGVIFAIRDKLMRLYYIKDELEDREKID